MEDDGSNIFTEYRESGGPEAFAEFLANSEFVVYIGGINNIIRFHDSIINDDDDWLSVDDNEEGKQSGGT